MKTTVHCVVLDQALTIHCGCLDEPWPDGGGSDGWGTKAIRWKSLTVPRLSIAPG